MERREFLRISTAGVGLALLSPLQGAAKAVAGSATLPQQDILRLMKSAKEKFYHNDLKGAQKLYEQIIGEKPYIPAYDRLTALYNHRHQFQKASALLREAVAKHPDNPYLLTRLAKALRIQALNAKKGAGDRDKLVQESLELSQKAVKNKGENKNLQQVFDKTVNAVAKKNIHNQKAADRVSVQTNVTKPKVARIATRNAKAVVESKEVFEARLEKSSTRVRQPLFDPGKEKLRSASVMKSRKGAYHKQLGSAGSPVEKQQLALGLLAEDKGDSFSYHLVRNYAKQNNNYALLEKLGQARIAEYTQSGWARLAMAKDLVFSFEKTGDQRYLRSAVATLRPELDKGLMDNPHLNSSLMLAFANLTSLQKKYKVTEDYVLKVLQDSASEDTYFRIHGLIAYSRNLERNRREDLALEHLKLILNPASSNNELQNFIKLLPSSAGQELRQNLPAYNALIRLAKLRNDQATVSDVKSIIKKLGKKSG
jgi:hypothetical protein